MPINTVSSSSFGTVTRLFPVHQALVGQDVAARMRGPSVHVQVCVT